MNNEIREQLIRLNEMSNDLFDEERRISSILREYSFCDDTINYLQSDAIQELIKNIDFAIRAVLSSMRDGGRLLDIIYHRYGLFGKEKQTLDQIAFSYGISRERIRQLQIKALKRLRNGVFEKIVLVAACQLLNIDITSFLCDKKAVSQSEMSNNEETDVSSDENGELKPHNNANKKHKGKQPFSINEEMLSKLVDQKPLKISEFVNSLNSCKSENMISLRCGYITDFLIKNELLELSQTPRYGIIKAPTEKGRSVGILTEQRVYSGDSYTITLYSAEAQKFIIENMEDIMRDVYEKDNDLSGSRWSIEQEARLVDLFQNHVSILEIAKALKRTPSGVQHRLKKLGLIS